MMLLQRKADAFLRLLAVQVFVMSVLAFDMTLSTYSFLGDIEDGSTEKEIIRGFNIAILLFLTVEICLRMTAQGRVSRQKCCCRRM